MVWDASEVFTVSGWGRLGSPALRASSPFSKKAEGINVEEIGQQWVFSTLDSPSILGFPKALKTLFLPNYGPYSLPVCS